LAHITTYLVLAYASSLARVTGAHARQLGVKLATLGDDTVDAPSPYGGVIGIGVGKCANRARSHPHLGRRVSI
jgi:hypothetical protein